MKGSKKCGWVLMAALLMTMVPMSLFAANEERALVRDARPVYPEMAKRMRVSGTVKLGLHISADGTVTKVDVLGGHPLLARAAVDCAKQRKYQPGPEETRTITIDFNL